VKRAKFLFPCFKTWCTKLFTLLGFGQGQAMVGNVPQVLGGYGHGDWA